MFSYVWFACEEPVRELHLEGPTEVRVSELGPVDAPRVVTSTGEVLAPAASANAEGPSWTLSRPGVARIDGGQIVAEGPGQVVIGTDWERSHVEWTLRVELHTVVWVVDPPASLAVGERRKLQVAARAGGTDIDAGKVAWSSSEPGVLTVDAFGIATAVEPGTSYLTAQTALGSAMIEVAVVGR